MRNNALFSQKATLYLSLIYSRVNYFTVLNAIMLQLTIQNPKLKKEEYIL